MSAVIPMNRRQLFRTAATLAAGWRNIARAQQTAASGNALPVEAYQPKSMLHVPETKVARSRYPVIDWHTHITGGGVPGKEIRFAMTAETCLPVMDRKNIRTMVDLTGGYGQALRQSVAKLQTAHPGRFLIFTEPAY